MDFDVEYFARLARIKLTDAEKAKFTKELGDILAYVEELKAVDTKRRTPRADKSSERPETTKGI